MLTRELDETVEMVEEREEGEMLEEGEVESGPPRSAAAYETDL